MNERKSNQQIYIYLFKLSKVFAEKQKYKTISS